MTCIDDECSLKQYKKYYLHKNMNNYGLGRVPGEVGEIQTQQKFMFSESNGLLWNFTRKLLEKSIRKFPKFTMLKITYSSFLLDHMGNKRESMRELNEC
jgi:hypothetical protein